MLKRGNRWRPRSRIRRWCRFRATAAKPTLQGTEIAAKEKLADGIEQAFDYRGDVTVQLKSGDKLEGYIFDRGSSKIRILSEIREQEGDGSA